MPRKILKSTAITVEDYYSERFLHIETELRHQRELMKMGFDTMNKRFDAVDKRFEAVDKRFEAVDKRFEAVDKRFSEMSAENNKRFSELTAENNKRFAEITTESNKRFDAITKRMDRFMIWSFGMTITSSGLILAAIRYWK